MTEERKSITRYINTNLLKEEKSNTIIRYIKSLSPESSTSKTSYATTYRKILRSPNLKNVLSLYTYDNFEFSIIENGLKECCLKIALFDEEFKFDSSIKKYNELTNEIEIKGYDKGGKNLESKYYENESIAYFEIEDVSWDIENISAYYAVVYNAKNNDLLFCIDFNGELTSKHQGTLNIEWATKGLEIKELNSSIFNHYLLDLINNFEEYSLKEIVSLISDNFKAIYNNEKILSYILKQPKILKALLNNEKCFKRIMNDDKILDILFNEGINNIDGNLSILDLIVNDKKLQLKSINERKFVDYVINNSDFVIRNCKNPERLIYSIVDKEKTANKKIKRNYRDLFLSNTYLKERC